MPSPVTLHDSAILPTVLGQVSARIPVGGKIRAGIKVLARLGMKPRLASGA